MLGEPSPGTPVANGEPRSFEPLDFCLFSTLRAALRRDGFSRSARVGLVGTEFSQPIRPGFVAGAGAHVAVIDFEQLAPVLFDTL